MAFIPPAAIRSGLGGWKHPATSLIPVLKRAGGQGVIVRGQGATTRARAMYRPDFDVLPPEVEANWPTLAQRFHDAGLKIGVCTRLADMAAG